MASKFPPLVQTSAKDPVTGKPALANMSKQEAHAYVKGLMHSEVDPSFLAGADPKNGRPVVAYLEECEMNDPMVKVSLAYLDGGASEGIDGGGRGVTPRRGRRHGRRGRFEMC